MASGAAKVALFDAFASAAQALGSGRRAEIVDLLAQGERSVEEIANEISQSVANTSQHLFVLARSDRKSTRLNSSHMSISYAVFCLKKKKQDTYVVSLEAHILCVLIIL